MNYRFDVVQFKLVFCKIVVEIYFNRAHICAIDFFDGMV